MTLAVLSESSADEAAMRTLLFPLVGDGVGADEPTKLRSRGWPAVLNVLPAVIKRLHYHTTIEALVVVVDSDDSTPHKADIHPDDCRFCRVRAAVSHELQHLTEVPNRPTLKVAVGLPMPAIEAWYLCGVDATVTEAAWVNGHANGQPPYTRPQLKERVYGTQIPLLAEETRKAVEHAFRLAQDLTLLDTWFPAGCGVMLDAVREW